MDVRTVAVAVNDQDRAVEFCVDRLGFDRRLDAPIGEGIRWIEVSSPGAAISIALTPRSAIIAGPVDSGIRLTTTDADADADAEHAAMSERGIDVDDVLRWPDVPAMFAFRDVDGNTLYVVETE